MRSNLINYLEAAYRADNPMKSLESALVTEDLLALLLPSTESSSKYPETLYNDLLAHRKQGKLSDIALQCKFQYFATAMVVVWETGMVAYVEPNRPLPCAWINVNSVDRTIQLRHFGGNFTMTRFRVIMHVMLSKDAMETKKVAFDTSAHHRDPIAFSQGSAVQLALRLDRVKEEEKETVEFIKPNPDFDCVVYVTLNGAKRGNVYYKTREKMIYSLLGK